MQFHHLEHVCKLVGMKNVVATRIHAHTKFHFLKNVDMCRFFSQIVSMVHLTKKQQKLALYCLQIKLVVLVFLVQLLKFGL